MTLQIDITRQAVIAFAREFIENPYLCYTEHGIHALFYTQLFNATPAEKRFIDWHGFKVCTIQKEYPTFGCLGKPKRQHWDIAVIKDPPECLPSKQYHSYDYLRLAAVVEFGFNSNEAHLLDDIERLTHTDSNVEHRFIVNLYRLSQPGYLFSGRDLPSISGQVVSMERVAELVEGKDVEILQGIYDSDGKYPRILTYFHNAELISLL